MNALYPNKINFTNRYGHTSLLYMTADSGRIVYRNKIDTIIGIKHPGIILGRDEWGETWVIHNHYKIGYAQVVSLTDFSLGETVFYDDRSVFYDRVTIVGRALDHWNNKREYHWLFNNCQHFVNKITRNENRSDAVDDVTDGAMIAGGALALIGLLSGNSGLAKAGLGIAGAGAIGKGLSRL